jgi:RimJ/RimL family protein N-acetyltransferase
MDWRNATLRVDDVEVRAWLDGDNEAVGTSPRDPVTGRYFGRSIGGPPKTDDPEAATFTICQSSDPVGRIWLKPGARPFEVGYFLRTDAWGKGIATRALTLVAQWLLGQPGVERVVLCTHPENLASQRVAERAGFVRDGVEAEYAEFKDGSREAIRFVRTA